MAEANNGVGLPMPGGVVRVDPGADALALVRDGPVLCMVLNAPARRNAVNLAMWRALHEAFERVASDEAVQVVVLVGAGGRAFCAGADISEFGEVYATPASTRAYNDLVRTTQIAIEHCSRPTVAMIEGACVGAGLGIALSCDIRLASPDAHFAVPPARLGIAYSPEDTRRLASIVGMTAAREMLLTARRIDAGEAHRLGVVHHVAPTGQLPGFTSDYLRERLLGSAPGALAAIKAILRGVAPAPSVDLDALRPVFDQRFESAEFRAAHEAFGGRRNQG